MTDARVVAGWWQRTTYSRVLGVRDFRLLWMGQVVSSLGTYAYSVAVASVVTDQLSGASLARAIALILSVQAGTAAVVGLLIAGPVADRFSRKHVMVLSDVVRFVAVASLLVAPPSMFHLGIVAAILGSAGALFEPSLAACLPTVVDEKDVVTANAIVGGTFYAGIMAGPAVGALVIAGFGVGVAFALNAASFLVSAVLIARTTFANRQRPREGRVTPGMLARDLVAGFGHLRRSRLAVAIMVVMCAVVAVAGAQATVQIVFVRDVLVPAGETQAARAAALAILTTAWGGGMLVGCFSTPPLIRFLPRDRVIPLAVALAGACVLIGSQSGNVWSVAALWGVAGLMCGITNVSYESLIQERTPDAYRGRVVSTIEAGQESAYFLGVAAAAFLAAVSPTNGLRVIGIAFTLVGVGASFLLPPAAARPHDAAPSSVGSEDVIKEAAVRPSFLPGIGSWPDWLSIDTPWVLSRHHDVVTLDLRWPLVPSDWPRLVGELESSLDQQVMAVVLPVRLPAGSTLSHSALEGIWAMMVERGVIVHRGDGRSATAQLATVDAAHSRAG